MKNLASRLLIGLMMFIGFANEVMACPSCKEGFKPGSAEAVAGEAFSLSVIFMLAVPMLIVGTFTAVLVRRMKQVDKDE